MGSHTPPGKPPRRPLLLSLAMVFFSFFAAVSTLMTPLLISGGGSYRINGESVTRDEFFAKAGFFVYSMPLLTVYVSLMAYAIYDERAWSRPLLLAYVPVCGIIGGLTLLNLMPAMSRSLLAVQLLEFVFFALLSWWYLYRKQKVVAYYRSISNAPRR